MTCLMTTYDVLVAQPGVLVKTSMLTLSESLSKLGGAVEVRDVIPSCPQNTPEQNRIGPTYTYNAKTTSVSFPWPKEVTGLERITLSAKGDLQRLLSAFFARPITVATVYYNTYHQTTIHGPPVTLTLPNPVAIASASRELPITQTRQVRLQCSNKTVCTATSTVRITSPKVANLFLVEKYAIGQTFARMGKSPEFELITVGLGPVPDAVPPPSHSESAHSLDKQLWRKYRLYIDDFECDILEVFPTREMFVEGTHWLGELESLN